MHNFPAQTHTHMQSQTQTLFIPECDDIGTEKTHIALKQVWAI